jgi:hypothetical protein
MSVKWQDRLISAVVFLVALTIAAFSAHAYAGAWNDGSRLATVEALVEYHTLAIDQSVFVQVPDRAPRPYSVDEPGLLQSGTADKLFIDGHYYSDKSPVPALLMAAVYEGLQAITGLTARDRTDRFCWWMTLLSSGLAYAFGVWCIYQLGEPLRLGRSLRLWLAGSFALATVALPYVRHVNNHILLLGVVAGLMLAFARLANRAGERTPWLLLLGAGTLTGFGYTIDLGAGPVLLLCAAGLVANRCRHVAALAAFGLAALPWLVLHHSLNYAVGGTLKPANAVPEYFLWPGCPFNPQNMTGSLNHSAGHFLTYATALLFGKRGFIGHNLPLFLFLPALGFLLTKRPRELPEALFAAACCGGTWLAYGLTSNNYSGLCCSIRWFVPLLAPAFYVLAVFLRETPQYVADFAILSGWGVVLAAIMWWHGPWIQHMVPLFWPIQAAALTSWLAYRTWRWRVERAVVHVPAALRPAA